MEQNLKRYATCEGVSSAILEKRQFKQVLEMFLNDDAATCEKDDTSVTFTFPNVRRIQQKSAFPVSYKFSEHPGVSGVFLLMQKDHRKYLFDGLRMYRMEGLCFSEEKQHPIYLLVTEATEENNGWFIQTSISTLQANEGGSIKHNYSGKVTIFEDFVKSLDRASINLQRLSQYQNQTKVVALQELGRMTNEALSKLHPDKTQDATLSKEFRGSF